MDGTHPSWGLVPKVYDPGPGERLVTLTRGFTALILEADWPVVSAHTWSTQINVAKAADGAVADMRAYAVAYVRRAGKKTKLYMHRLITGVTNPQVLVDHRDHDTLNNRRRNLLACTFGHNAQNVSLEKRLSSVGYRGVRRKGNKYQASLDFLGEYIYLGVFDTAEQAARAYDSKVIELYGPYGWTNFDNGLYDPTPVYEVGSRDEMPF
jgi:hypothetical protein